MKESFWGYFIITLGLIILTILLLVQRATVRTEEDFYLGREVLEASMLDAVDYGTYRTTGRVVMSKEKFVEVFIRRFAESVTNNKTYELSFYDIYEDPPKATVRIQTKSGATELNSDGFDVDLNTNMTGILETIYGQDIGSPSQDPKLCEENCGDPGLDPSDPDDDPVVPGPGSPTPNPGGGDDDPVPPTPNPGGTDPNACPPGSICFGGNEYTPHKTTGNIYLYRLDGQYTGQSATATTGQGGNYTCACRGAGHESPTPSSTACHDYYCCNMGVIKKGVTFYIIKDYVNIYPKQAVFGEVYFKYSDWVGTNTSSFGMGKKLDRCGDYGPIITVNGEKYINVKMVLWCNNASCGFRDVTTIEIEQQYK